MDRKINVILIQRGLSQVEIAKRMGVHQPKVSEWLNGRRMPSSENFYKLAEVLNVEPLELAEELRSISQSK